MVNYILQESPKALTVIFQYILNPMLIYSLLIVLLFVINLLNMRIAGLASDVTASEKETKGVVLLWRDELIKNKMHAKLPSPVKKDN